MVWSPLGWGRLTGKIGRNKKMAEGRIQMGGDVGSPPVDDEFLYTTVDTLERMAFQLGKSVPQVAINWLLQQDTVSNVVIGARNEQQLLDNLGSVGWKLPEEYIEELDILTRPKLIYPHWVGER